MHHQLYFQSRGDVRALNTSSHPVTVADLFKKGSLVSRAVTYQYFSPREWVEESWEKREEVDEGDFEKMEHGRLLRAALHPSP